MSDIKINAPGAGDWIMKRVQGVFTPVYDNSFSVHRDGEIIGGFAVCTYLGNSATVHTAGEGVNWCPRDLLWLVFDYTFNQLNVGKLIAPVRSDNYKALSIDLRAGWHLETMISDLYAEGVHGFILSMTRDTCPWLKLKPRAWTSNIGPVVSKAPGEVA